MASRVFGGRQGQWFRFTKTRLSSTRRGSIEERAPTMKRTKTSTPQDSPTLIEHCKTCSSPRSLYMSITDCSLSISSSSSFSGEDDYEETALPTEPLEEHTEAPTDNKRPRKQQQRKRKFGTTKELRRSLVSSTRYERMIVDRSIASKGKSPCFGQRKITVRDSKKESSKCFGADKSNNGSAQAIRCDQADVANTTRSTPADDATLDFQSDTEEDQPNSNRHFASTLHPSEKVNQPSSKTSLRKARAFFERLDQHKLEVVKETHNKVPDESSAALNPPPTPIPGQPVFRTQRALSMKNNPGVRNVYRNYLDVCKEAKVQPISLDVFWEQRKRQRLANSPKGKLYDGFFEEA